MEQTSPHPPLRKQPNSTVRPPDERSRSGPFPTDLFTYEATRDALREIVDKVFSAPTDSRIRSARTDRSSTPRAAQ
jgi:hypothetical protein